MLHRGGCLAARSQIAGIGMRLILGVIVLFLVVGVVIWRKKRRAAETAVVKATGADLGATNSKFHAVSIRPGADPCNAVLALEGQRFLSEAAPPIPLPNCDSRHCRCRFVHFADRRSGDERRSPYPATIGLDSGTFRQEQREGQDRRKEPPESP